MEKDGQRASKVSKSLLYYVLEALARLKLGAFFGFLWIP
jgi:hypothetical protein